MAALINALHHEYDIIRYAAAVGLGATCNPLALPTLEQALSDTRYVGVTVVEALGKIRVSAIPCLTGILADPASDLRGAAAKALGTIGDSSAVPALAAALKDPDIFVRREVADALGAIKPSTAPPELIAALSKEYWTDDITIFVYPYKPGQEHVADALGEIRDTASVGPLIEALEDPMLYDSVYRALGEIGDQRALPVLLAGLNSDDRSQRQSAAKALSKFNDKAVIPALEKILGDWPFDDDTWTGLTPADILASIGPEAFPVLIQALRNGEDKVRWTVAQTLAQNKMTRTIPEAIDALIYALDDENLLVRKWAANGLQNFKVAKAVPALCIALGRTERPKRYKLAETLGKIGDPSALPALIAAITDPDKYVRQWAARAIGWIEQEEIPTPLLQALTDEDAKMRACAAIALGELGNTAAVQDLIKTLDDDEDKVRRHAVDSLGWIKDPSAIPHLLEVIHCASQMEVPSINEEDSPLYKKPAIINMKRFSLTYTDTMGYDAACAIGNIGGALGIEALTDLLSDTDERVRYWAVAGLGHTRDVEAIVKWRMALKDTHSDVRKMAAEAIQQIIAAAKDTVNLGEF